MRSNLIQRLALSLFLVIVANDFVWAEQGLYFGETEAPVLGATVEVRVTGIIARTKVTQIFQNPSSDWAPDIGREPRAVFYSEEVDGEKYALLMVMPPDAPGAVVSRLPRETIFIIDTSGSMEGPSMPQAREALLFGLGKLQAGDWFNVVEFDSTATSVFPESVPATPDALEKARRFITGLNADGGTMMLPALQIAFRKPAPAGLVPQVIFATDGQLGDEEKVVQFLKSNLGNRRLFPVAIGAAPNVPLLRRLGDLGSGSFTAITDVRNVQAAMGALFSQLESPMLRQIEVQWSDLSAEAWPSRVPDLYLGDPLVVTARLEEGDGAVTVSGLRGGAAWQDSFAVAGEFKGAGIDKLWARRKIQGLSDSLADGGDPVEVRRGITALGLRHHLVTDHTSLMAVDPEETAPSGLQPVRHVLPVNAPVEDIITVTAESPLLDARRITTSATVSQTELEEDPHGTGSLGCARKHAWGAQGQDQCRGQRERPVLDVCGSRRSRGRGCLVCGRRRDHRHGGFGTLRCRSEEPLCRDPAGWLDEDHPGAGPRRRAVSGEAPPGSGRRRPAARLPGPAAP